MNIEKLFSDSFKIFVRSINKIIPFIILYALGVQLLDIYQQNISALNATALNATTYILLIISLFVFFAECIRICFASVKNYCCIARKQTTSESAILKIPK